jgi:hypothetical protein
MYFDIFDSSHDRQRELPRDKAVHWRFVEE